MILQFKKNRVLYSILSFCALLWIQSCKETPVKPLALPQVNRVPIPTEKIPEPEIPVSNSSVPKEFSNWPNYPLLDTAITNLENGDPIFFKQPIEDINQLFLDIKKSVPNSLKTNSILARVKVTETLARKLHELYSLEDTDLKEAEQTKSNLIKSHTNLIFQINKTREKEAQRITKPI